MTNKQEFEQTRIDRAKIIVAICVEAARGDGTEKNPIKKVNEYYLIDGTKIGELSGC